MRTITTVPTPRGVWHDRHLIVPGLTMGAEPVPGGFDGFDLVVNVAWNCDRDLGLVPANWSGEYVHLPLLDHERLPKNLGEVRKLVDRVVSALGRGERVLVHCQAGLNRSGLVVALALLELGHEPQAAIALMRERRDKLVLCNRRFERFVRSGGTDETERTFGFGAALNAADDLRWRELSYRQAKLNGGGWVEIDDSDYAWEEA